MPQFQKEKESTMINELRFVVAVVGVSLLASCGGSGGGNSDNATVSVAMTDSASDQVDSFTVDVTRIQLTHKSGAVVNVVSSALTVDLTSLSDLSQIL